MGGTVLQTNHQSVVDKFVCAAMETVRNQEVLIHNSKSRLSFVILSPTTFFIKINLSIQFETHFLSDPDSGSEQFWQLEL